MGSTLLALLLMGLLAGPAFAGDAVVLLQEARTPQPGRNRKPSTVQHVALLKNTSARAVHGLRVTVELYDSFGKLLWSRTVSPGPSSLGPGDSASLSLTTPHLDAYKKTVYRFDYRTAAKPR
jgi:hypothetical protein